MKIDYSGLRAGNEPEGDALYTLFDQVRRDDPVWHAPWGDWYVSTYAGVNTLLRSDFCVQSDIGTRDLPGQVESVDDDPIRHMSDWLLFQNPPNHQRQRRLMARLMAGQKSDRLECHIAGIVERLLRDLPTGSFDFVDHFSSALPVEVICEIAHIPMADRARVVSWSKTLRTLLDLGVEPINAQQMQHLVDSHQYFMDLTRDPAWLRAAFGGKAGLAVDQMSDVSFANNVLFLVFSGHETTVHLLGTMLLHLTADQPIWHALKAGQISRRKVIEEALRLESPIQKLYRINKQPIELHGITIPADSAIVLLLGAANRDPAVFERPDRIAQAHPSASHLAFGLGTHYCLGTSLAMLESDVTLKAVIEKWKGFNLTGNKSWIRNSSFRGLASLEITIET